nr:MAG TPA: hypothetical protein [Caudoviricetes sp.]
MKKSNEVRAMVKEAQSDEPTLFLILIYAKQQDLI